MRERTRAKLDPLGSGESRTLWVLLAGSTGVYATVMTIAHWTVTPNPGFAIAGTGLAVLAAALTIWWTAPRRSPFTGRRHVGIHITALLAMAATLWAQNHATFDVGDAYPVFIITGLVVAMSPYRPPTELVAVGVTSTVIAGFLVLIRVLGSDTTLPALVLAVIAVSPILALTAAAATYTETILRTIERARHSRQIPTASDTEAPPDRVTAMTRDTLPLLQRILKTGTITRADRVAAIRAAAVLRATLVAEVNRTWLDATQQDRVGPIFTITDPAGLARDLTAARRTVLRALLGALATEPGFTGGNVTLAGHTEHNQLTVEANYDATEYTTPPGHPVVSALLTVMRSVFTELETDRAQSRVLIKFGYEHD